MGIEDHLKMAGLPAEFERWHKLAQDRGKWRKLIGAKPDRVGIRMPAVPHHTEITATSLLHKGAGFSDHAGGSKGKI